MEVRGANPIKKAYRCCYDVQGKCPYLGYEPPEKVFHERNWFRQNYNALKIRVCNLEQTCLLAEKEITRLRQKIEELEFEKQVLVEQLKQKKQKSFQKAPLKNETKEPINMEETQLLLFEVPKREKIHKRGAPQGHPGTTWKRPDKIDEYIDIFPKHCHHCGNSEITPCENYTEHIQQDIEIKVKNTCYRHYRGYCKNCGRIISETADKEIPRTHFGPQVRTIATYLRYNINIPYQKLKLIFQDVFGLHITQSSLYKFDLEIAKKGEPYYKQLSQEIKLSEAIFCDETSWYLNGMLQWLWCFTNHYLCYYDIDNSRGSKVISENLGEEFEGVLISDFYSAYSPIKVKAKQKCFAHLLRDIRELYPRISNNDNIQRFLVQTESVLKDAIKVHKEWKAGHITSAAIKILKGYFLERIDKLIEVEFINSKAEALRKRLLCYRDELFTFLDYPQIVDPTNNRTERQIRPSVIFRKITYGNKSHNGIKIHAIIMSLIQTAKLNGKNPLEVLQQLVFHGNKNSTIYELLGIPDGKHKEVSSLQLTLPFDLQIAPKKSRAPP